jgi:hypothetical protein
MKNYLKEIFQNVNDWLKFAEAKHAGLIVLNSGIIFGILSIYKDYKENIHWMIVIVSIAFLGLSMITSFISLFPKLDNKIKKKKKPLNLNLYYFRSIALLDEEDFKKELKNIDANFSPDKLDNDLINQIIVNSRISLFKYRLFRFGTVSAIIGLTLPVTYIIIKVLCH